MSRKYRKIEQIEDLNINLAPFIDILFVLLIAFMVPTQFLFGGLEVELPSATAKIVVLKKDPIKIFVGKDNRISINGDFDIKINNLCVKINELSLKDKNIKIYVMADKNTKYGDIIKIVGMLKDDNFRNVTLITDIHNRL